jgi:hypothetical protein
MSSKDIKKDPFIKSIFDEAGEAHPSASFTTQIINVIKSETKESAFVYKPIISKNAWLVMAFLVISLFVYLLVGNSEAGQGINLYGYSLNMDTSIVKGFFSKLVFSFELSPILKTSFLALIVFTFSNLIIFELRSRSFFK